MAPEVIRRFRRRVDFDTTAFFESLDTGPKLELMDFGSGGLNFAETLILNQLFHRFRHWEQSNPSVVFRVHAIS